MNVLGKIDLGLTDVVLKPSKKKYDSGIYARISKWKAVEKAALKIVVQTKDEKVAAVPISVETKVGIVPGWFNTFGASYEPVQKKASFSRGSQAAQICLPFSSKPMSRQKKRSSVTVVLRVLIGSPLQALSR